jgi:hypothetical protein
MIWYLTWLDSTNLNESIVVNEQLKSVREAIIWQVRFCECNAFVTQISAVVGSYPLIGFCNFCKVLIYCYKKYHECHLH